MTHRRARIFVIEDNPGDFLLVKKAFSRARIANELEHCDDGETALARLRAEAEAGELPDLVLLDLHLPGMSGKEVLAAIRADEKLRHLPVVVMTSSKQEKDILRSYKLGASSFVTKPPSLSELQEVVSSLHQYWFVLVKLPGEHGAPARG